MERGKLLEERCGGGASIMKKFLSFIMMSMMALSIYAKDIKTVVFTTDPQMHCESCEKRIKGNIRFVKGVKKIETSVPDQTVTITYDADKTTVEKLVEAFKKIDYDVRQLKEGEKVEKSADASCDM